MYINEPLPECEAQIQAEANKLELITSTHNCVVSVLVEDGSRSKFKAVHDVNELDTLNKLTNNYVRGLHQSVTTRYSTLKLYVCMLLIILKYRTCTKSLRT